MPIQVEPSRSTYKEPPPNEADAFMRAFPDPVNGSGASFEEPDAASPVTVEKSVGSIAGQAILDREPLNPAI